MLLSRCSIWLLGVCLWATAIHHLSGKARAQVTVSDPNNPCYGFPACDDTNADPCQTPPPPVASSPPPVAHPPPPALSPPPPSPPPQPAAAPQNGMTQGAPLGQPSAAPAGISAYQRSFMQAPVGGIAPAQPANPQAGAAFVAAPPGAPMLGPSAADPLASQQAQGAPLSAAGLRARPLTNAAAMRPSGMGLPGPSGAPGRAPTQLMGQPPGASTHRRAPWHGTSPHATPPWSSSANGINFSAPGLPPVPTPAPTAPGPRATPPPMGPQTYPWMATSDTPAQVPASTTLMSPSPPGLMPGSSLVAAPDGSVPPPPATPTASPMGAVTVDPRLGVPVVTLLLAGLGDDILTNLIAQAAVLDELRASVRAAVGDVPVNITLQQYYAPASSSPAAPTRHLLRNTPHAYLADATGITGQSGSSREVPHTSQRSLKQMLNPAEQMGPIGSGALTSLIISNASVADAASGGAPEPAAASSRAGGQLIAIITFPVSTAADQQSYASAQQLADNIQADPASVLTGPLLSVAQVQVVVLRLDQSSGAAPDESEAPSAGALQRAAPPAGTVASTPPPPPPCDPTCSAPAPASGRRLQQWMPDIGPSRRLQAATCCPASPPPPQSSNVTTASSSPSAASSSGAKPLYAIFACVIAAAVLLGVTGCCWRFGPKRAAKFSGLFYVGKGIAWVGKKAWKHFPGRKVEVPKKQSILERADAAHSEYDYVQLADGRLVAVNAAGDNKEWQIRDKADAESSQAGPKVPLREDASEEGRAMPRTDPSVSLRERFSLTAVLNPDLTDVERGEIKAVPPTNDHTARRTDAATTAIAPDGTPGPTRIQSLPAGRMSGVKRLATSLSGNIKRSRSDLSDLAEADCSLGRTNGMTGLSVPRADHSRQPQSFIGWDSSGGLVQRTASNPMFEASTWHDVVDLTRQPEASSETDEEDTPEPLPREASIPNPLFDMQPRRSSSDDALPWDNPEVRYCDASGKPARQTAIQPGPCSNGTGVAGLQRAQTQRISPAVREAAGLVNHYLQVPSSLQRAASVPRAPARGSQASSHSPHRLATLGTGTMRLEHLARVASELKVLAGRLESQGSLARTRTADLLRLGSQATSSSLAKAGSLMSGMVGRHQASDEPAAEDMEDGNPFAFHPPAEMMRTLPSLQASFTSAANAGASTREPSASDLQLYAAEVFHERGSIVSAPFSQQLLKEPSASGGSLEGRATEQHRASHDGEALLAGRNEVGSEGADPNVQRLEAVDALAAAEDLLQAMSRRRTQNARESLRSGSPSNSNNYVVVPRAATSASGIIVPSTQSRSALNRGTSVPAGVPTHPSIRAQPASSSSGSARAASELRHSIVSRPSMAPSQTVLSSARSMQPIRQDHPLSKAASLQQTGNLAGPMPRGSLRQQHQQLIQQRPGGTADSQDAQLRPSEQGEHSRN
ncbi:hypothetical protein WJX84_008691 [Apatococcus fuscideae]|uniref:Uncharacterized protein n=1 Tax=Apatococcus fuscideae TaxID=2026836 RepID=A0AAW1TLB1_9CHLO